MRGSRRRSTTTVVDIIVERPECHRFVVTRFWTRYPGTAPAPAVIDDLATAFGRRLVVHDLLLALFTHPAFYADDVLTGLVAQPIETVVNAVRGFGTDTFDATSKPLDDEDDEPRRGELPWWLPLELLFEMDQFLAHPPNVGGWPHNEAWLDATRSIGRLNAGIHFARTIVEADTPVVRAIARVANRDPRRAVAPPMAAFGHVDWSADTDAAIVAALVVRRVPPGGPWHSRSDSSPMRLTS